MGAEYHHCPACLHPFVLAGEDASTERVPTHFLPVNANAGRGAPQIRQGTERCAGSGGPWRLRTAESDAPTSSDPAPTGRDQIGDAGAHGATSGKVGHD